MDFLLVDRNLTQENQDSQADDQERLSHAAQIVDAIRQNGARPLTPALAEYARLLVRDGQYELAQQVAQELLLLEDHSRAAADAFVTLGMCMARTNRLDEAERYFHQSADLCRKIQYRMGLARALQSLTNLVLFVRGEFHLALALIDEAGVLFEEEGARQWGEPFLRGLTYEIVGDLRHSRQILDDMIGQVRPGTRLAAAFYFLWARLAMDEDALEQAKENLHVALRVANRIDVSDISCWVRLEYSRYYRLRQQAHVARTWANDALKQAERMGIDYFRGLALIERAQVNWESGDALAAESDLEAAERALEPLRAAFDLTRIRFWRAVWHQQTQQADAETVWLEALRAITHEGYAFLLEKEQDQAFPLIAAHLRSKTPAVRSATEQALRDLSKVSPPALRMVTLGQFGVWKGRRRIPDAAWTRRKAGELLRYLLLQHNRAAGREVIIEALWPDADADMTDTLHQATSALRHALEPDLPDKFPSRYVRVEGEHITLLLPTGSLVDFEQFERNLPLAMQSHNTERLMDALNLYAGDLFPSDRYADWSAEKRQSLAELRQRGLLALAQAYLEQNQYFQVLNCARQILQADTWNEDAVLLSMRAYAGMGEGVHALRMYQDIERTLAKELQIQPRDDLRDLARALRAR